jgi:hypothetical protein
LVSNRLVSLCCLRRRPRSNTPSARVPSRAPVESVSPSPRDKDRERQPENRERELDIDPPRRRSTTPGAGRDRPGSSTAPPRQNAKKKKYGAALDPTHHQRGCHPARRSNPSAPRQGIKTASASRKIGRESSTLTHPAEGRRRQVPAAIGPVARRRRRAKTLKRKFTAPPSIQHTISAGAIPRAGRIRQPLAKG